MQDYFSISVQGKWVECKKALPRLNYSANFGLMMRGAKRLYFDKDQDETTNSQDEPLGEPMPLKQASMNQMNSNPRDQNMVKPQMLPKVSQQNFAPNRVNIDLEAGYSYEDKENFNQQASMLSLEKENYYGSIDVYSDDIKAKPKDPRKGTILELKNKSSRCSLP